MRKKILALYDPEKGYAVRFMETVNRRRSEPFEVRAFTREEELRHYLSENAADVVLLSGMDGQLDCAGSAVVIALTERPPAAGDGETTAVCRYQSSTDIMKKVEEIYGRKRGAVSSLSRTVKTGTKLVGVYSPICRCMKTSFAVALGQLLARKKSVIFLSFETCSGFEQILHMRYEEGLADALFYIKENKLKAVERIRPLLKQIGDMNFLPPAGSFHELREVTEADWEALIEVMKDESGHEAVVIDFAYLPDIYPDILTLCDRIYMPVLSDFVSDAKLAQNEKTLCEACGDEFMEKILKIQMRNVSLPETGDRWFEMLPYSRLGSVAGACIERDGL
ncbi:MAG: hypothetical protein SOH48_04805 [Eubacteriales bacterium]|jgi:hypothetical protein